MRRWDCVLSDSLACLLVPFNQNLHTKISAPEICIASGQCYVTNEGTVYPGFGLGVVIRDSIIQISNMAASLLPHVYTVHFCVSVA